MVFNLATVLRDAAEGSINRPEYERRLASSLSKLLGYQQLAWLVEHQDKYPVFMDLLGKIYVDFSGLVVVDEDGDRASRVAIRTAGVGTRTGTGSAATSIRSGVSLSPASSKTFGFGTFGTSVLVP